MVHALDRAGGDWLLSFPLFAIKFNRYRMGFRLAWACSASRWTSFYCRLGSCRIFFYRDKGRRCELEFNVESLVPFLTPELALVNDDVQS